MIASEKKEVRIAAPAAGRILDITEVSGDLFASRTMGDGFAVEPEGAEISAPCDGRVAVTSKAGHEIAILRGPLQVILHVGTDGADRNALECCVQPGQIVKKGMPLIRLDRNRIGAERFAVTTTGVLPNSKERSARVEKNLYNPDAVLTVRAYR
ncbi:MAG: PTS glucose transporter subunit IIA [Oscillospiraceae bacterium]|nr:PTS glucose transporter subunit IIA [Oscillospiraceae bacterium]